MLRHTKGVNVFFITIVSTILLTIGACGFHFSTPPLHPANYTKTVLPPLNQPPRPISIIHHGNSVSIQMYAEETEVWIAHGVSFPAWTFDGMVPGPTIELRQGEDVNLTLRNLDPRMAHSLDLHAALVPPNQDFISVLPGHSKTIHFVANIPGVFMYHCESSPIALHIAQGMYGAVVVMPRDAAPPLYTLVQSEFYRPDSLFSVLNEPPRYVVFNGYADRYVTHPLLVPVGVPFTIALVNAGPNDFSAFHVVGSILREVQVSGFPANTLDDISTATVPPGGGILIHLEFAQPGQYPFVSHVMNQMSKGAMGIFDAVKESPSAP